MIHQMMALLTFMQVTSGEQETLQSITTDLTSLFNVQECLMAVLQCGSSTSVKMLARRSLDTKQSTEQQPRFDYIKKLLSNDLINEVQQLCDNRGEFYSITRDDIYVEYARILYTNSKRNRDDEAAQMLLKIRDPVSRRKAALTLLDIARPRIALLLQRISKSKQHVHLLSEMPPQLFQYVTHNMSAATTNSRDTDLASSVHRSRALLENCVNLFKTSDDKEDCSMALQLLQFVRQLVIK
jgi:hypothetical protein